MFVFIFIILFIIGIVLAILMKCMDFNKIAWSSGSPLFSFFFACEPSTQSAAYLRPQSPRQ